MGKSYVDTATAHPEPGCPLIDCTGWAAGLCACDHNGLELEDLPDAFAGEGIVHDI